jgi:hypothetical protein
VLSRMGKMDVRNPSSLGKKGTLYSAPTKSARYAQKNAARNFRACPELPGSLWRILAQHSGRPGTCPGTSTGTSGHRNLRKARNFRAPFGQMWENFLFSPEPFPEPYQNFRPPELPGSPELPSPQKTASISKVKHA